MSKFVRTNWELVILVSIQYLAQTRARRVLAKSEPFGRSPWSCFSRILHFFANHAFAKRYVSIYVPLCVTVKSRPPIDRNLINEDIAIYIHIIFLKKYKYFANIASQRVTRNHNLSASMCTFFRLTYC